MRERLVVICVLVRDHPHASAPSRREFCADCRSRVWLSDSTRDGILEQDARPLPVCADCARIRRAESAEPIDIAVSDSDVARAAAAAGISLEAARAIVEEHLARWRA